MKLFHAACLFTIAAAVAQAGCAGNTPRPQMSLAEYAHQSSILIAENLLLPELKANNVKRADVSVRMSVLNDGTITGAQIKRSSGFPVVDDLVLAAVKSTRKLSPVPDEMRRDGPIYMQIPFIFDF